MVKKPDKGLSKHPRKMSEAELLKMKNDEMERGIILKEREVKAIKALIKSMERVNANPSVTITETYDAMNRKVSKVVEISPRQASLVEYKEDSKGQIHPRVKVYHEDPKEAFIQASALLVKAVTEAAKHSAKS